MAEFTLSEQQLSFLTTFITKTSKIDGQGQDGGEDRTAWDAAYSVTAERVSELVAQGHSKAAALEGALAKCSTVAETGDVARAIAALAKVDGVLDGLAPEQKAGGENVGGISLVKLGIARVEWPKVQSSSHAALRDVQSAIQAAYAPFPSEAAKVAAAVGTLDGVIDTLNDTLKDQLDDVYNAQDDAERAKTVAVVRKTVSAFKTFVETDPVAKAVDGNSFAPGTSVMGAVQKNLSAMMTALGG